MRVLEGSVANPLLALAMDDESEEAVDFVLNEWGFLGWRHHEVPVHQRFSFFNALAAYRVALVGNYNAAAAQRFAQRYFPEAYANGEFRFASSPPSSISRLFL